ncbi:tRNA dihydrouridine synthase [Desulfoluna spongiiphila]|uniref:tRNA dihydrouridine synthase n=1 Tax=Desulfoluna spongiiphila TaxID=419481 RepID=UPI001252F2A8|nr:tRNA-dihydrouridine synthase family protein [Desulfoluna spongiiphila]VVS92917.1 trna-dihydrouridine synthase [Desulfoluna spongiiphila]
MTTIPETIKTPITIGGKEIPNRLFLAPLAGLGHVAMRQIIDEFGSCGLFFSEMCSARALPGENRLISPMFRWRDQEAKRLVMQIVGAAPLDMALAAERIEQEGLFGVDINFGCSVAGICKKESGAAVLRDPDRAEAIVREVRNATTLPLFVKYRTGWTDDPVFAADMARRFEDAGADALVFHPRVSPDRRSRPPKWQHIKAVKESVAIPVFGNGNVFTPADLARMVDTTGCDGVSLGRIAIARPFVFAEMLEGKTFGPEIYPQVALRFLDLVEEAFDAGYAVRLFKKFVLYFAANFKFGHPVFKQLAYADTLDGLRENVHQTFAEPLDLASTPNLNLFTG